ncbi:hypothetical protein CspeluHIS016_0901900 [Cutaneotrichosporon spelunceum]|uniref:Uncharacterized protein n=1 Tax=Cutaneotrichosporon spelunceum TaxID=1672016 RepID=A0AAD3U055_9TREE|nr:hypothetical protein CspeluHIS016_0901900 [Cutaneotrichosporon spelunceum]
MLDQAAYPHIVEAIIDAAAAQYDTALAQRSVCRTLRTKMDTEFARHLRIERLMDPDPGPQLVPTACGNRLTHLYPSSWPPACRGPPHAPPKWQAPQKVLTHSRTIDIRANVMRRDTPSSRRDLREPRYQRPPSRAIRQIAYPQWRTLFSKSWHDVVFIFRPAEFSVSSHPVDGAEPDLGALLEVAIAVLDLYLSSKYTLVGLENVSWDRIGVPAPVDGVSKEAWFRASVEEMVVAVPGPREAMVNIDDEVQSCIEFLSHAEYHASP